MTVHGEDISPAPVFLGANPARVSYAGRPVVRPLAPEEDLARDLLDAIGPGAREAAIVSELAPSDIRSSVSPRAQTRIEPLGIAGARLDPTGRAMLDQLVALYLGRLPRELATREAGRLDVRELYFAWEGPTRPGQRHYYRVQGPDLLVEYDNTTDDGNHAHTVLRRPLSDFGDDILSRHLQASHR
jgi:hypothetical protein